MLRLRSRKMQWMKQRKMLLPSRLLLMFVAMEERQFQVMKIQEMIQKMLVLLANFWNAEWSSGPRNAMRKKRRTLL